MYVLVQNNVVLNGPRAWSFRSFENTLLEECGIEYKLPVSYNQTESITIAEGVAIYSVEIVQQPFNVKTEYAHGPFWDFETGIAVGTYQVVQHPIESVRSNLKDIVASNRWKRETLGFTTTIQDTEVFVSTSRDTRNQFALLAAQQVTDVDFKFGDVWLKLTSSDISQIASEIHTFVQQQFVWEREKIVEIDLCGTLPELDAIDLGYVTVDLKLGA